MPLFLSAVAGVLVMHQSLGSAAVDSLAAIGVMDPKVGVPLLLAILFYSNIFTRNDIISHDMLVSFPFISWFVSLVLNGGHISFAFWLCYLSPYLDIPFFPTVLAAKSFGSASITRFTFCDDSAHSSNYPANASQGCKTVRPLNRICFLSFISFSCDYFSGLTISQHVLWQLWLSNPFGC